jgi:hypothetical protein
VYHFDSEASDEVVRRHRPPGNRIPWLNGAIPRLGNLDVDLGGKTSRYTGSLGFWNGVENTTGALAYVVYYDFDLWSSFTYFLDDPVNGDEFSPANRKRELRTSISTPSSRDRCAAMSRGGSEIRTKPLHAPRFTLHAVLRPVRRFALPGRFRAC